MAVVAGKMAIAFFAVVALLLIGGAEAKTVELDKSNFDETLSNSKLPHFVMYYAPWCGHCKALKPTWETVSDKVEDKAVLAKVDCDNKENQELCQRAGVKGYPTLVAYSVGDTDGGDLYEGGRDAKALTSYVEDNMGPGCDVTTLENCKDDEKTLIAELKSQTADEMEEQIEFYTESVKFEDKKFEDFLKNLQEQYEKANAEAKKLKAEHRAKIKVLKALQKAAASASGEL